MKTCNFLATGFLLLQSRLDVLFVVWFLLCQQDLLFLLFLQAVGIATHDFPGQQDGDLPFRKGDRITILEQIDSDWLRGESNGMQGIFPATFVQIETGDLLTSCTNTSIHCKFHFSTSYSVTLRLQ